MSARVLFATSNGTGLGHLNRAMAIARRLPSGFESSIFTLSEAAPVVAAQGFEVDYLASYRRPASGTDRAWNLRLRAKLEQLLAEREPDLVVFDGVHPYRALTHVLSATGAPTSIWCRRAMWRPGTPEAALGRVGAFDAVLEPGELAAPADRGPTVRARSEAVRVDPIVYLDEGELLDRESAAGELGLDPSRPTALVALGQGGGLDFAVRWAAGRLLEEPDQQVAVLRSGIAAGAVVPDGARILDATFPMSRYFRAFDVAVAAAGYNAFHELIAFAVPTLFVPMRRNTDDQEARARWAAANGLALHVRGPRDEALGDRLNELCDPAVAGELKRRCRASFPGNGAAAAAELIAAAARGRASAPRVRDHGRLNRWLRLSAHPVGPTLPLVLALGGRDLLRHPERRAPRLLVLALGIEGEPLVEAVRRALGGGEAARTLVITDSLEFASLRGLGVAFEHVSTPARDGELRPAELAALEERLRVLTRGRKPIRAVSVGSIGAELLDLAPPSE